MVGQGLGHCAFHYRGSGSLPVGEVRSCQSRSTAKNKQKKRSVTVKRYLSEEAERATGLQQ